MQNINDLRQHLFDAIAGLKSGSMEIDRAKAISEISQTIINTAKVEVDFIRETGAKGSGFIDVEQKQLPGRTLHRLAG